MNKHFIFMPLIVALLASSHVCAETFLPLSSLAGLGKAEAGVALTRSNGAYSMSDQEVTITLSDHLGNTGKDTGELEGDDGDITRTLLSGYYARGVTDTIDAYGVFALSLSSELSGFDEGDEETFNGSGSGFIFGGGVRGAINTTAQKELDLRWCGQLLIINEDYGSDTIDGEKVSIDGSAMELSAGILAVHSIDDTLRVYGGLEFMLTHDVDLDVKASFEQGRREITGSYSTKIDRDSQFGLKFGAQKDNLFFNVGLLNEVTFSIGYMQPL